MRDSLQKISRFLLAFLIATPAFSAALRPAGNSVSGEVLVKIQAGASGEAIAGIQHSADVDRGDRISTVKSGTIWRFHSRSLNNNALTAALQNNPNVAYVEPNYIVHTSDTPNDPSYPSLWGLRNVGQSVNGYAGTPGADISAEAAWSVTTGSSTIVVGVIDTGVDYTHPDLAANIWSNPGGKGNAGCAAGTHGFNAITRTCDPRDDHYHGTHVAGTIGALGNNSLGVVGVNWSTSIMALKFLDSQGYGNTADAIVAIEFAIQAKIDGVNVRVLSNSWGGGGFSKALLDEINKANENDILVVASAGNDGSNNDVYPKYPASYSTANMIAVAATDNRDGLAWFSNYGLNTVHLAAPGVDVLSCYPGGTYIYLSGTSMAAPHVSGVAALILAKTPSLTTAQVKSAILNNTDPISSVTGKTVTGGRLNAARAVGAQIAADFSISVSPSSRSVVQGASTAYSITVTPANGFTGSVDLAVSGLPSGASGTFSPPSTPATSTLTVTTGIATPLASTLFSVTGSSAALSHSTSATLAVVTRPPTTSCPAFSPAPAAYTGYAQSAVAIGDFDRDGKTDLAMPILNSNQVYVVLGRGDGTFQYATGYNAGTAPLSVAVGDFNRDGKPDLAVANSISNNISIFLGAGDGTFQSAVNYATGTNPFWVAVGDFDGNGKPDLVTANDGSNDVSILLGQGDGTFLAAASYSAGQGPYWVATGDLNGDGRTDVAVADSHANKVSVLLGNGDGTLQSAVAYGAGSSPSSVAIGDLNGDGKADLAVSNSGSNNVSVLLGSGSGVFQAAVNYPVASGPSSVAIVDINGDGQADLSVANTNSNSVSLLAGRGDGTFVSTINYPIAGSPNQVVAGDFNGDGRADLVMPSNNSSSLVILINTGVCSLNCNTLAAPVNYPAGLNADAAVAGDFNGDGQADLVVANAGANNLSALLGNGDGTLQPGGTVSAGTTPDSLEVADFNGDGKRDLAVANGGASDVSILLGNGNGSFQTAVSYGSGSSPHAAIARDFNRDGKADLAVANSASNSVSILAGNGDGTFQPQVSYGAGTTPESIAAGDFNRDGKLDLAVANSASSNLSILLGNGDATFQTATSVSTGTTPLFVVSEDFNRDGRVDLAVANSGSNNVSILLGNTSGGFQPAVNYSAGTTPRSLTVADLNDDGRLDIAVMNAGSNNVSILLGNGNGTFVSAGTIAAGTGPRSIVACDLNRDGKPDLAVANSGSANVSILLNTCPAPDLVVAKTHSGSFAQGSTGKIYTLTVSNIGTASTDNLITVTDTLPNGLMASSMSGAGWSCNLALVSCSRSDFLTAGSSYQPITLTVSVTNSAAASITNQVTVSGGGEVTTINSTASDPTTITPVTDLVVTNTHAGSFTQGDTGKSYKIVVRNPGGSPTSGAITVSESLQAGLTASAISGSGWTCTLATLTCTRSDVLAANSSYPVVTVTVNVAANAPSAAVTMATVSGGGEVNTLNDTANDPTTIWSSQTCGSVALPVFYSLPSSSPGAVAIGDFNGDGKSDLAVTNSYFNSVSVFLGNGTGALAASVDYGVGITPRAMSLADLNNDGKTDFVVANGNSNNVSVLLGNGNGTFATAMNFGVGPGGYPNSLVVADFNGDGNADVVAANTNSNSISVLLGNGNGTLQPVVVYSNIYSPYSLVHGDFNGDGKLDLAFVTSSYYVEVMAGNGDGTFQTPPLTFSLGNSPNALATADFNGDGKLDLAISSYYSGIVTILLANGTNSFLSAGSYNTGYGSSSMAIDDLNGDGKPDIVVSNTSSFSLSLLLGTGTGSFQAAINYPSSTAPGPIAVGDFNGDGKPDFALGSSYDYRVGIMLGGCPDLTITKSHSGNFTGGQSNATYTLIVSNAVGSTQGTVTAADALPNGMTATAMSGSGWICDLTSVSCTRGDSLGGGSTYPVITLAVDVSKTAAASVINTATVSGGGDTNPANNSASDPTTIVQVADLTITKTHEGSFAQGQNGRTYTISVGNSGGGPTTGTVTVTDTLPPGLSATAMTGAGWNCALPTRTCTRSDALAVNASYPAITLTVDVDSNCPANVTNVANVWGGGEAYFANDTASDPTRIIATATNLVATAISTSQVSLTWDPVANSANYQVLRSSSNGPYTIVGAPLSNSFVDPSLTPNTTYLYRVRAVDASVAGQLSNVDLATTIFFTDDPLIVRTTSMKAVHLTELRIAVNAVRAAAGLAATSFSDPSLATGLRIKAIHLTELRTSLDAARLAIGMPAIAYTDPALAAGSMIKAAHVRDLRSGVK